jgi:hypothetical protein
MKKVINHICQNFYEIGDLVECPYEGQGMVASNSYLNKDKLEYFQDVHFFNGHVRAVNEGDEIDGMVVVSDAVYVTDEALNGGNCQCELLQEDSFWNSDKMKDWAKNL